MKSRAYGLCKACARQCGVQRRGYASGAKRRDYAAAVEALNALQSNFSVVEAIKLKGPGWNKLALPEMREWVRRIGYEVGVSSP
jgi:hypothetical protein